MVLDTWVRPQPLTAELLGGLAESFHHAAEDQFFTERTVRPLLLLLDASSEAFGVADVHDVAKASVELYTAASKARSVAAIWLRAACAPKTGMEAFRPVPETDWFVVTESRWPARGVRTLRISRVLFGDGTVRLHRLPDGSDLNGKTPPDTLSRILPWTSKD